MHNLRRLLVVGDLPAAIGVLTHADFVNHKAAIRHVDLRITPAATAIADGVIIASVNNTADTGIGIVPVIRAVVRESVSDCITHLATVTIIQCRANAGPEEATDHSAGGAIVRNSGTKEGTQNGTGQNLIAIRAASAGVVIIVITVIAAIVITGVVAPVGAGRTMIAAVVPARINRAIHIAPAVGSA